MANGPPQRVGTASPTLSRRARRLREAPRRAGDVNEAALLEVARELVHKGEFKTTQIGQIAKLAGISRQGFYFYYQSKDELLTQLVTETLHSSAQTWRTTLYEREWAEPSTAIREQVEAAVTMWRRHREVLRAGVELGPLSLVQAQWVAIVKETADFLVELVVSSTKIEALRDPDAARHMMETLIWMIERNCYMHVVYGSDESDAALAQRLGDVYLRATGIE